MGDPKHRGVQTTRTPARRKPLRSFASKAASYQKRPQRGGVRSRPLGPSLALPGRLLRIPTQHARQVKSVSTLESVSSRTDGKPGTALAFRGKRLGRGKRMSNSKDGICPICHHSMTLELQPSGMPTTHFSVPQL
jgi:hypothetical protein